MADLIIRPDAFDDIAEGAEDAEVCTDVQPAPTQWHAMIDLKRPDPWIVWDSTALKEYDSGEILKRFLRSRGDGPATPLARGLS